MSTPSHWRDRKLGDIGETSGGGTPSTNLAANWGGGIPWLVPSEVSRSPSLYISTTMRTITDKGLSSSVAKLLPKGTVMMTSRATIGEVVINQVPMATNQGFINVVCNPEIVRSDFLAYWIRQNKQVFIERAHGVTFKEITKSNFKLIPIALPPIEEQRVIAQALDAAQRAKLARQRELALERERKAALMEHLFTHGTHAEPTKQTEIGEMPESWGLNSLSDVARITSGGTPDRSRPDYWNGGIPWVKTGEIRYDTIHQTDETISQKGLENSAAKIIPAGTLLMAMYGQGITRGKVAILGINAALNQACAAILLSGKIVTRFAFFYLQFAYERIRTLGHGANQKNLNAQLVGSIQTPIPPREEQEEICRPLVALDAKLSALERECSLLDELFRAMLEELMTGQLSAVPLIGEHPAQ